MLKRLSGKKKWRENSDDIAVLRSALQELPEKKSPSEPERCVADLAGVLEQYS